METIFCITVALLAVAIISVVLTVRKSRKLFKNDKPVLHDDAPARYEDFEECFYNPEM